MVLDLARSTSSSHPLYNAERVGDLQLLVTPYSSSNYPQGSLAARAERPAPSHAVTWMYGERVPIVVWSPGRIEPRDHTEASRLPICAHDRTVDRVSTSSGRRGRGAAPGIPSATPPVQPRVVVTLVIDGGG